MEDRSLQDDGLFMDEQGAWCEDKYKLVGLYIKLFATGMKFKWDQRVFIDLYSGAGIAKIRGTGRLVMGSPLIALNVADPFDSYVFCEKDEEKLEALKQRAHKIAAGREIHYIAGDCNSVVDRVLDRIPRASSEQKVLSLCCVDPFDIGIKFSTIEKLSTRFVDFLVLLAVYMDANRAYVHYLKPENKKVDDFLGLPGWREIWEQEKIRTKFPEFLARQYSQRMTQLGYLDQELYKMKRVRSDEKNLPLYRLALFSRNRRAYAFWDEVLKYSTEPKLF
jgi:three-Cys-motif partner protein